MAKYRKRPIVIEAFQLTAETRWSNVNWPQWMHAAWAKDRMEVGSLNTTEFDDVLDIMTLNGRVDIQLNEWIIQGVKGELYPCKPDIFGETYELEAA